MTETEQNTPTPPEEKSPALAKRALVFSMIALIIALIAGAVVYLTWQQQSNLQSNLQDKRVQSQAQITALQEQVSNQQKQMASLQLTLNNLQKQTVMSKQYQQLSQIAYLVNLANLNLSIGHDPKSAEIILNTSLQKIAELNDPALFTIKKSLNDDLVAIKKAQIVNPEDLVLRIDALNQKILALTILPDMQLKAPGDTAQTDKNLPWYKRFWQGLANLKDLFVIRKLDKPIAPLISPQQEAFLKQNIQTKLMLAEWAVLHQQPQLYQNSLNTVKSWLNDYFHDPKTTAEAQQEIAALLQLNVKPTLPDLSNSLSLISQMINQDKPSDNSGAKE